MIESNEKLRALTKLGYKHTKERLIIGQGNDSKQFTEILAPHSCLEEDVVISIALMDMCGKCGEVKKAKEVFGELTIRDLACWTTLISGYAHQKLGEGMLSNICGKDSNDKGQKS